MSEQIRVGMVGGGSPFVLMLLHGLLERREQWIGSPHELVLVLYDLKADLAERWAQYAGVIRRQTGLPVRAEVVTDLETCLRGAHHVLFSPGVPEASALGAAMQEKYGFSDEAAYDGPQGLAAATRVFPLCRTVAEKTLQLARPGAMLVIFSNPPDVLSNAISRATGISAVGSCVEVNGLQAALAHFFHEKPDNVILRHAGVNHEGLVLELLVNGENGYELWRDGIQALPEREDFHPGHAFMVEYFRLTGYLPSSAYHPKWPLERAVRKPPARVKFGSTRQEILNTADEAIRKCEVLDEKRDLHPERRIINHLGGGIAQADLLRARISGEGRVVPLQVRNNGAISNLPPDVQVEVPVLVRGAQVIPCAAGALPEDIGGITRILAIQRKLKADYLLDRKLSTLQQALAAYPLGAPDTLTAFARELHGLACASV